MCGFGGCGNDSFIWVILLLCLCGNNNNSNCGGQLNNCGNC